MTSKDNGAIHGIKRCNKAARSNDQNGGKSPQAIEKNGGASRDRSTSPC
jgi:hypothetical protein